MRPANTRLLLPEYGRNVQKMVIFLKSLEDREQRNRQAEVVVGLMGNLYPYKRDTEEFRHMLWDHLFMIADFDLDIDAPFAQPTSEQFSPVPSRVPYSQGYISHKHYGAHVAAMARSMENLTDEQTETDRTAVAISLAKYMRQRSFEYNHEFPSNEVVIEDLVRLSAGTMVLSANALNGSHIDQTTKLNSPNATPRRRRRKIQ